MHEISDLMQLHIIIILSLSIPVSCVNAPDSDGPLYKREKFDDGTLVLM